MNARLASKEAKTRAADKGVGETIDLRIVSLLSR